MVFHLFAIVKSVFLHKKELCGLRPVLHVLLLYRFSSVYFCFYFSCSGLFILDPVWNQRQQPKSWNQQSSQTKGWMSGPRTFFKSVDPFGLFVCVGVLWFLSCLPLCFNAFDFRVRCQFQITQRFRNWFPKTSFHSTAGWTQDTSRKENTFVGSVWIQQLKGLPWVFACLWNAMAIVYIAQIFF